MKHFIGIKCELVTFAKPKCSVRRKFFVRDKNYVLEEVQLSLEKHLLQYLVDFVKLTYMLRHNPLGIEDRMVRMIRNYKTDDFRHLHEFYVSVMAVYRYKFYADNQLDLDFSGRDPAERYRHEWPEVFKHWVSTFCRHQNFLRAVLDLTVFYSGESRRPMDTRMQTFITHFFDVRIHPQKGIVQKKAA